MIIARVRAGAGAPVSGRYGEVRGGRIFWLSGSIEAGFAADGGDSAFDAAALLAPVAPSKIVAVGSNYPAHAAEMGKPLPDEPKMFLKPPTSVIGPGQPIRIPPRTTRVDPEGELGVIIGRRLVCASPAEAAAGIFGYTCLNDVTARDFQKQDGVFARAKGFDTFCPVGPWIVTADHPGFNASDLEIRVIVNGEHRSVGRTSEMHVKIPELLSFMSGVMTLLPGDVIATGTPAGMKPICDGDHVIVRIEGIGELVNPVIDREDRRLS